MLFLYFCKISGPLHLICPPRECVQLKDWTAWIETCPLAIHTWSEKHLTIVRRRFSLPFERTFKCLWITIFLYPMYTLSSIFIFFFLSFLPIHFWVCFLEHPLSSFFNVYYLYPCFSRLLTYLFSSSTVNLFTFCWIFL